jgi:NAD(P)-dependent dehydrogenase (short-subunit alcohol dehydrogenase family)
VTGDPFRLDGAIAIVTGGTHGIGRGIAELFRDRGATVVACGRNPERGSAFTAETGIAFVQADVTDDDAVRRLIEDCPGPATVLVNNAGPTDLLHSRAVDGPVGAIAPANWAKVIDQTLTSAFLPTHYVVPKMIDAGGGSIINISSVAACCVTPGFDAYGAGKGGMEALTRGVAVSYAHRHIRCNAIRVGSIAVDHGPGPSISQSTLAPDTSADEWRLPKPPAAGSVDDIANAALYLASPASKYVTGSVLTVDGGMTARSLVPWQTDRP